MYRFQYVGRSSTPFRYRFTNYKACYRKLSSWSSVAQMNLFRHCSEENHHGFLQNIRVKIIDRLVRGKGYVRVSGNIRQTLSHPGVLMLGKWKHSCMTY